MAHKNVKTKKMVVLKSKLKILAYRPEVQQMGMTSVFETRQSSHVGHVLTCHSLRMCVGFFCFFFAG